MRLCKLFVLIFMAGFLSACSDFLDLRPKDKLDGEALFSDPEGVKLYMANLYSRLPIEDFNYLRTGFNAWYGENMVAAMFTDEATHSEYAAQLTQDNFPWWEDAYSLIRDVNTLSETIPSLAVPDDQRKSLAGEVAFIRAYIYFGLAKRYGGVPIIEENQEWEGDVGKLKVPRLTEKETWDYAINQAQIAAENLPLAWDEANSRRATSYVALALKTRIALHAASIAKFGSRAILSGEAVDKKYVGLTEDLADGYYRSCIKAAEDLMSTHKYSLYMPAPESPEEAAENYRKMFEDPSVAPEEVIFIKGYTRLELGHNYNIYYGPSQLANGWPHPGRMNPNLELVDAYESYSNPGHSAPVVTSDAPDDLTDYSGYDPAKNYYKFDTPYGIFEDKDARLWGTVILPGTQWKNTTINIQAGYIEPDGTPVIYSGNPYENPADGKTYYVFGGAAKSDYSGFDTEGGNYTRTGFSFKKFLDERIPTLYGYNNSLTDWIEFRYAEVLLNYAEAVVESGYNENNAMQTAKDALNSIRKRAGHTVEIELTPENVQRERLVELSFENKRFWDLIRRREYHTMCSGSVMHALLPIADLRENPVKYIFVRAEIQRVSPFTFLEKMYYHPIPGITVNGLVQNPQY